MALCLFLFNSGSVLEINQLDKQNQNERVSNRLNFIHSVGNGSSQLGAFQSPPYSCNVYNCFQLSCYAVSSAFVFVQLKDSVSFLLVSRFV